MSATGRARRCLIGTVIGGATLLAGIGFTGSYAAVRELAEDKGFGAFAVVFPVGIDAGIVVLLALDLLLTWQRMPLPLLRHTAWLLTAATIAFNGATAWPDLLGTAMHAVIPLLFVVAIEAARHAIGQLADITAGKYMEGMRVSRWLLAFPSTFRLWRRRVLWELRDYDEVIRLEQDRLVYKARLRARYGRRWRRKAPVEAVMPLKLVRYGMPLRPVPDANVPPPFVPEREAHDAGRTTPHVPVPELEAVPEQGRSAVPVRPPRKTPTGKKRAGANGTPKTTFVQDVATARTWLGAEPDLSGAKIGKRLGKSVRHGQNVRAAAVRPPADLVSATAGDGPAHRKQTEE